MLIKSESNSHWYRKNGNGWEPCYELPCKTKPGQMRSPTVRDARALALVPSVTNVLSCIARPGLEAWKQEQVVLSSLTLPRLPDESDDAFAHRVIDDAGQQSLKARDKGTAIHDLLASFCMEGMQCPFGTYSEPLYPFVGPTMQWLQEHVTKVHAAEAVVGDALGFAGRLDLHADVSMIFDGPAVLDFKTQEVKGKEPICYPEWGMQLAAYAACVMAHTTWPLLISVVINTAAPTAPFIKLWDNPYHYWKAFEHAFHIWKFLKGYDPASLTESQGGLAT